MRSEATRTNWEDSDAALLRVYVLAGDRTGGQPLADALVLAAREAGILGATVLPGIAGFGRSGRHGSLEVFIHDPLSQPFVVEFIDAESHLRNFIPVLERLDPRGCLATIERVDSLSYHAAGDNHRS